MFRNTWCASVRTELSNAPAAWTSDSKGPPFRTVSFGFAGNLDCVPVFPCKPPCAGLAQHIRGPVLLCHYPRMVAFANNRSFHTGSEVQRTCFSIEFPEP